MKNINIIVSIFLCLSAVPSFAFVPAKTFGFIQTAFSSSTAKEASYGFQLNRINLITNFEPKSNIVILADLEYEGSVKHSDTEQSGTFNLSRAYIDYGLSSKITFRVGRYLSPFGLYNEIHDFAASYYLIDAPRLYQVHIPFSGVAGRRFFSKNATGIQIYGKLFKNARGGYLGYGLSIGNGADEKASDGSDQNKSSAISLHTYYKPTFYGTKFGMSYHRDRLVTGIGGITNDLTQTLSLEFERESTSFLIQLEGAISQFKNPNGLHQNAGMAYVHVAYLKHDKFIPFFEIAHEVYNLKKIEKSYQETIIGASYNLTEQLFIKTEFINSSNEKNIQEITDRTLKIAVDAIF